MLEDCGIKALPRIFLRLAASAAAFLLVAFALLVLWLRYYALPNVDAYRADILSSIEFPYPVVPIVRAHHENWDGSGYPNGLTGAEIPIGARILSVVDCYDALTSDRPYRGAMSDEEALAIIRARRGDVESTGTCCGTTSWPRRTAMKTCTTCRVISWAILVSLRAITSNAPVSVSR